MADKKKAVASFDEALQATRKERNAKLAQEMLGTDPKKLAQEMLGKNRRTSTPRVTATPASLASRVGVTKRSNSLPRSHTAPPRNPRQPSHLSRPPIDDSQWLKVRDTITISSDSASDAKSNGYARQEAVNGGGGLNIRGAAGGPYIVRAQNFAPGTTAADIESVMQSVGGQMSYCKLVASTPTVIAEMSFMDRTGAESVIETFNNKKADGRLLYVYFEPALPQAAVNGRARRQPPPPPVEEEPLPAIVDTVGDTEMEIDEHAEAREAENKQREQRRGRDEREPRYPSGPRQTEMTNYVTGASREEPYQDRRYGGYAGGDRRFSGRGGFRGEGRMYSDGMRRGGGQSYRP